MEGRIGPEIRSKLLEQFFPKAAGESWISVIDHNFWNTMMFEQMINEELGAFLH